MDNSITGTLRSAVLLLEGDPRCPCLRGYVYGDVKGRFRDGELVTTSTLQEHKEGQIFKTRFSTYKVESWF